MAKKRRTYSVEFQREKIVLLESEEVRIVDLVQIYGASNPPIITGKLPAADVVALEKDS